MTKSNVGRKKSIWLYVHIVVDHWRKPGQKPKQGKNLEAGADTKNYVGLLLTNLLIMPCSACLLTESRTNSPGLSPLTEGWNLFHQSLPQKMPYSWILWSHFLSWGLLILDDFNFYEVDIKLARILPQMYKQTDLYMVTWRRPRWHVH